MLGDESVGESYVTFCVPCDSERERSARIALCLRVIGFITSLASALKVQAGELRQRQSTFLIDTQCIAPCRNLGIPRIAVGVDELNPRTVLPCEQTTARKSSDGQQSCRGCQENGRTVTTRHSTYFGA